MTQPSTGEGVRWTVVLQGMFNDDAFSKIKKGARIINVARGGVIDDHALARALDNGQVAQVSLLATPACFLLIICAA